MQNLGGPRRTRQEGTRVCLGGASLILNAGARFLGKNLQNQSFNSKRREGVSVGEFPVDVVAKTREFRILNDTRFPSDVREWFDTLQAPGIDLNEKARAAEAAKLIGMALAGRLEDHRTRGALPVQTANAFHIGAGNHITKACLLVLVPGKPTIRRLPELPDSEPGNRLRSCEAE